MSDVVTDITSLGGLVNVINAGISAFAVYDKDPVWAAEAVKLAHAYLRQEGRPSIEWTASRGWRGKEAIITELGLDKSSRHGDGYQMLEALRDLEATLRPEDGSKRRRSQFPSGLVIVWDTEQFWKSGAFRYLIPALGDALRSMGATVAFILPTTLPPLSPLATVLPQVAAGGDARARYLSLLEGLVDSQSEERALEALDGMPVRVAAAVMDLVRGILGTTSDQDALTAIQIATQVLRPPTGVEAEAP